MPIFLGDKKFLPADATLLFRFLNFLQGIPAFLREKVFFIDKLDPVFFGECFCARTIEHDMR